VVVPQPGCEKACLITRVPPLMPVDGLPYWIMLAGGVPVPEADQTCSGRQGCV
jgi:hypothetical protein